MNIVITGFMGTGKTAAGRLLARKLGREFIDTDALVETKAGKSVAEIFADSGEAAFRDMETAAVEEVSRLDGRVIATGGGVPLRRKNMDALKKNGIIINLTAHPSEIFRRTASAGDRPLLKKPDVRAEIEKLLAEREPFYADCDWRLDTGGIDVEEAVSRLMVFLESRGFLK